MEPARALAGLATLVALAAPHGAAGDALDAWEGPPTWPGPERAAPHPDVPLGNLRPEAVHVPAYAAGLAETLLRDRVDLGSLEYGFRVAFEAGTTPHAVMAGSAAPDGTPVGVVVRLGQGVVATVRSGLWDALYGIAVDGPGDIVAGGCAYDPETGRHHVLAAKVAPDGAPRWLRTVPLEPRGFFHCTQDLALDAAGNAVLAGLHLRLRDGRVEYDTAVAKLDPAGNVLWARVLELPGTMEYVLAVDVDRRNGDILLGGLAQARALVLRLDGDGALLARREVGLSGGSLTARGLAVDAEGHVLLAAASPAGAVVVRLRPDLEVDWTRVLTGGGSTGARDVAVDAHGNAVVAGGAITSLGADLFLAKLTPLGIPLFVRLVDGEGGGAEVAYGVATTPDGLFVATGGIAMPIHGHGDMFGTVGLGLSGAGAVAGAVNAAANVRLGQGP